MQTVLGALVAFAAELLLFAPIVAWKPVRTRTARRMAEAREAIARLYDRWNLRPPRLAG
jgi:hypothetical protein